MEGKEQEELTAVAVCRVIQSIWTKSENSAQIQRIMSSLQSFMTRKSLSFCPSFQDTSWFGRRAPCHL